MLPNVGMGELVVILLIVVLLFGAKRLPEIAKGMGQSVKVFKDALNGASGIVRLGNGFITANFPFNSAGKHRSRTRTCLTGRVSMQSRWRVASRIFTRFSKLVN